MTATLIADALGLEPSEINEGTGLETSASWDSLAHFRIILAIEETLGRPLSPAEIFETTDYLSVDKLLSA
jgi:acyl carrier protein